MPAVGPLAICELLGAVHTVATVSGQSSPTGAPEDRLFATAATLRELVNLFCDRELDDDLLDEIAAAARQLSEQVAAAPQWDRQVALVEGLRAPDTGEGRRSGFPHRAVGGDANPGAHPMAMEFDFDAGLLSTEVTFQPMHGGAPGRVHGGVLAGVFDEFAGATLRLAGTRGATARLCINYRAPIPMGVPLRFTGWVDHREDRKIVVRGDARRGEDLIADFEGLFVVIDYAAIDTSGDARH